ncbi:hypothetical protein GCM10022408_28370 [Hymenobacter fastidiosus]|uniref:Uncharacterized protein n=1 Tax=Hymenobacter fastidiosus TaxID=486264 RepID=A0ABP7SLV1_9BACT
MVPGQLLQGYQRVRRVGVARGIGGRQGSIVDYGVPGPLGQRLRGKVATPEMGAVQGEKQGVVLRLPRIGADGRALLKSLVKGRDYFHANLRNLVPDY